VIKKPPLTDKKRQWLGKRKTVLRGTKLSYNASKQDKYRHDLRKLVIKMTKQTKNEIIKLFNSSTADDYFEEQKQASAMDASIASQARILLNALLKKFMQLFAFKSQMLAENMFSEQSEASKRGLHASLKQLSGGLSLKTGVVPAGMKEDAKAIVAENVSLIKSIPEQYFKNVTGAVMRSITTGHGMADLLLHIQKFNGQTERRAKNLALDQTRKAYNQINKQRMQAVGVKQFEWVHSHGGQFPRKSHMDIDGKIFSFENLEQEQAALGVPSDDRGLPGHPINCRCTMVPVIKFE
jgi:SPP1 gp7 family putative phage head morphogenesis protein